MVVDCRASMGSHPDSEYGLDCSEAFALGEGPEGLGAGGNALRVTTPELLDNDAELAWGEEHPSAPIEFVRDEGRRPRDLIGTTYATLVLVSDRLLSLLEEHGFTGWATFPARVLLDDGDELKGYHGFAVTGRCGPIDDSLSEEITIPSPVPGGRAGSGLRGLCFPPETWDGSDVFTAEGYTGIFVVERVKEALEQAQITNVDLRRLSEIERRWRWTPSGPKVIA